jgi:hypothetical protein
VQACNAKIPTGVTALTRKDVQKIEFMKNKAAEETSRAQQRNGNSINFLFKEKMEKYGSSLQSLATAISLGLACEERMRICLIVESRRALACGRGGIIRSEQMSQKANPRKLSSKRALPVCALCARPGLLWQQ